MTESDPSPETPQHPLRVHNFRCYFIGRLAMTLAQYAMLLIIGWQTYNMARDAGMSVAQASGQLALIGLFQFLPLFVLTPFSGLAADRFDRRRLGQAMVAVQLLCAGMLAITTLTGAISTLVLFAVAGMLGIARCFSGPALSALAPNLVPRAILPTAIALSSIAWQAGTIAGPAIGGVLYGIAPALPYAASTALLTITLIAFGMIGKVEQPALRKDVRPIGQILDGLAYVVRNKMVLGTITLDLFAVFLAGATALFPVYARDILQSGEVGLAMLAAAPGVGALVTAAWFSWRPIDSNVGTKMLWSVAVFGIATIIFGVSTAMPLSLAMLFIIGAADMFSVYIRQSLIQLHTPDDKRGRVSSVSQLTISASNEGGDFFSGSLAFLIGPVAAVVAGGVGAIITVALWSRLFPVLRTTKTFDPPPDLLNPSHKTHPQEA
ncbi:MAG: MFS transporter [Erythrobacter sp.]